MDYEFELKTKIIDAIENGTFFAKCVTTVEDGEGIYCIAGNVYEVIDLVTNEYGDDCYILETEGDEDLQIKVSDLDFDFYFKE